MCMELKAVTSAAANSAEPALPAGVGTVALVLSADADATLMSSAMPSKRVHRSMVLMCVTSFFVTRTGPVQEMCQVPAHFTERTIARNRDLLIGCKRHAT